MEREAFAGYGNRMATPTSDPAFSKTMLTAVLIAASTLILVAGIVLPPYLRSRSEQRQTAALTARAQPVLDAIITAEATYKEREGKFWRDEDQVLSADNTKKVLGVDIATASDFRFAIAPPDLVADPTLRIEAKATGADEGFTFGCVYDSIAHTKSCKKG
jgi:hypothetical protein